MTVIDDKVVAMSFESSKFESGVNKAITSLDKLKASLTFKGATKGLDEVSKAAKGLQLGHIGHAVDDIRSKLGYFSVAALAVFASVAKNAVAAGAQMVKALTLDPIALGFNEYTTKLNAVQTILANTQAAGVGIKEVNATLKQLNEYSDKTIYNFGQMARNIGTFTAAGVDLQTATGAIKGIANLAALSGSSAEQASTAMYQLSQAIAAGKVSLVDWNSVVNAGMGGTVFQRALAQTAEKMGTLKKGTLELVGPMKNVKIEGESFRNSLAAGPGKDSWLTKEVLTSTLKQFTGDLSDAELAAQGFNKAEIASIQKTAEAAMKAATEVKTLGQVFNVAKETAGSGWAETFQIIFGNFNEAKKTFTDLSETINGFINANADARNKVLEDWKKLGGRAALIDGIKNSFHALMDILRPIKDAFRDIFPATTGQQLFDLTKRFQEFTETLKPSPTTIENLRRTFRGLFAALDIVKMIIGGVIGVFARFLGKVSEGTGGFLDFTGGIGDFIVKVRDALKKGEGLENFFDGLGDILEAPLVILGKLKDVLADVFGGLGDGAGEATGKIKPFQKVMEVFGAAISKFLEAFSHLDTVLEGIFDIFAKFFKDMGPVIAEAASNMNFEAILQVIRTGLFAGIFLMLKKFLGKGAFSDQLARGFSGIGGGILKNISGSFAALQGSLVGLQQNIKAKTLKEIAIAVGILALSMVALSFVDPEKLGSALTAMTVAFGQLLAAMAILTAVTKTAGFIKLPVMAAGLILLAGAILVLSASIVILSMLSWEELAKGLIGVGVALGIIAAAAIPLAANSGGMIRAGAGITAMAVGLLILANAVKSFAEMNWTEMTKGFLGVAIGLGLITAAVLLMPPHMPAMGLGLIAVATGLKILAGVVITFSQMNWETMGKGLAGVAGGLAVIAGAMHIMPKGMILQAAGLLLVAVALQGIVRAVADMGGMSIEVLAKGLGALAISLAILAGALQLMSGTVTGAIALGITAAAIALLVPQLITLGSLSWGQIIKGLVALAGALAVIGVAAALMTPAIPALLGLGVALLLIGAGLALAGAGIALVGIGLSSILVALPTGVGIMLAALTEFRDGLLKFVKDTILGLLEVLQAFAEIMPQFVKSIVDIVRTLIGALIEIMPEVGKAIGAILTVILETFDEHKDEIVQAGFDLLIALLTGIKNNIGALVAGAADVIVNFLGALKTQIGRLVVAGIEFVAALLKGIVKGVGAVAVGAFKIIIAFLKAIGSGNSISKVVNAGVTIVAKFIQGLTKNVGRLVTTAANFIVKVLQGIAKNMPKLVTAGVDVVIKFMEGLGKNAPRLSLAAGKLILQFLRGIEQAVRTYSRQITEATIDIGVALVEGFITGVISKAVDFKNAIIDLLPGPLKRFAGMLGLRSPSRLFHQWGVWTVEGFINGLTENKKDVEEASVGIAEAVVTSVKDALEITSPSKVMKRIGQDVMAGFAEGLLSATSQRDVNKAFDRVNSRITKQIRESQKIIDRQQKKLKKGGLTSKERKEATDLIKQNRAVLTALRAGRKEVNQDLKENKGKLLAKAKEYADATKLIADTRDKLANLRAERASLISSTVDQFNELPDMLTANAEGWKIDAVAQYTKSLEEQAAATKKYRETLATLRGLGLDDETYRQLLEQGTAGQEFADQLVAAGPDAIEAIDVLNDDLLAASEGVANDAAIAMYDVGIASAEALIKATLDSLPGINAAMDKLSKAMIKALKRALGIKSPSKVFAALGMLSMEGMAKGFSDGTPIVTDAADQAAQDALLAMKEAMSTGISEIVELDPVITPILDLTQVENEARRLADLTKIDSAAALEQASSISIGQAATEAEKLAAVAGTTFMYEQNNYSPEALTEVEIYRQTRNQLSLIRSKLALA